MAQYDFIRPAGLPFGSHNECDCFKLTKVYDWLKLRSIQRFDVLNVSLPNNTPVRLDVVVNTPLVEARVTSIERTPGEEPYGCIGIQKIVPTTITAYNVATGAEIVKFAHTFQIFDSTKACIPYPLDASNVNIKVTAVNSQQLTTSPVNNTMIVEVSTCQDIEVLLNVKAKIEIKGFCESKQGVPCFGTVACDYGLEGHEGYYPPNCDNGNCKI